MAVTTYASGTQTATIGTEHTLSAVNQPGVYVLYVDTVNLAAGDVLELRAKRKVLAGSTTRSVLIASWAGEQPADDRIKVSVPLANDLAEAEALVFTLQQTFGTGRAFPWSVLRVT